MPQADTDSHAAYGRSADPRNFSKADLARLFASVLLLAKGAQLAAAYGPRWGNGGPSPTFIVVDHDDGFATQQPVPVN